MPNNTKAYERRGREYMDSEQYDKAVADFSKAVELYPSDYEPINYLCESCIEIYYDLGKYELAVKYLDKLIEIDQADLWSNDAYKKRGECYQKLGDEKKLKLTSLRRKSLLGNNHLIV